MQVFILVLNKYTSEKVHFISCFLFDMSGFSELTPFVHKLYNSMNVCMFGGGRVYNSALGT